jgi:hypothetical protein
MESPLLVACLLMTMMAIQAIQVIQAIQAIEVIQATNQDLIDLNKCFVKTFIIAIEGSPPHDGSLFYYTYQGST